MGRRESGSGRTVVFGGAARADADRSNGQQSPAPTNLPRESRSGFQVRRQPIPGKEPLRGSDRIGEIPETLACGPPVGHSRGLRRVFGGASAGRERHQVGGNQSGRRSASGHLAHDLPVRNQTGSGQAGAAALPQTRGGRGEDAAESSVRQPSAKLTGEEYRADRECVAGIPAPLALLMPRANPHPVAATDAGSRSRRSRSRLRADATPKDRPRPAKTYTATHRWERTLGCRRIAVRGQRLAKAQGQCVSY